MNLKTTIIIGVLNFIFIFAVLILAYTKSKINIFRWSLLVFTLFLVLVLSWYFSNDMALQWVFIEASTLIGALLISMSLTEKSLDTAWKFLLLNSFGLSIAFLGLIILSYGAHTEVTMETNVILNSIKDNQNKLVEIGMWLVVFGYSAKLGLVPSHFWVSDTYAESPSQVSSVLSSFIPVSVCIALRPIIKMDKEFTSAHFHSADGLLVMGIITMVYSLLTLYQTTDIRRMTALIALFHSGSLGVFLWLDTSDEVFFYVICGSMLIKSLLFSSMGILRLDTGSRIIEEIGKEEGLSIISRFLFITSICMAFVVPLSPVFLADLLMIKLGLVKNQFWIISIPILGLVFFTVGFYKILHIMNIKSREFKPKNAQTLYIRSVFALLLLLLNISLGLYGLYMFAIGGFDHV